MSQDDITVLQAARRLRILETTIRDAIRTFEDDTGMVVTKVKLVPGISTDRVFRAPRPARAYEVGVSARLCPEDAPPPSPGAITDRHIGTICLTHGQRLDFDCDTCRAIARDRR